MALELKQSLNLTQQLIMTPQLQQAIKLLQLSRLELLDAIYEELEINPVLDESAGEEPEEERPAGEPEVPAQTESEVKEVTVEERAREDVDWESYLSEYNTGWAETAREDRELPQLENITSRKPNLSEHLMWQLGVSNVSERHKRIGEHIIGNLNEDGYLEVTIEELMDLVPCSQPEALEALWTVRNFDPAGVAARDMQECLLLQCKFQQLGGSLVETIIAEHLAALEAKKYDQIAKKLGVSLKDILQAVSVIQGLEPKPGRLYAEDEPIYITPDIYVFKVGDDYEIVLNEDGLPKLRVSAYYREVLSNKDGLPDAAKSYIQEKLRSAAWLIKSIHQRQRTIYRVTESIVRFQRAFLDHGITRLRPLVLRDVAEDIEMHESTVSRVTTNKYVYTPRGVFELKFFFNSAISATGGGEDVASESVKEQIRNIIKTENKTHPYSDQEIAALLRKMKIKVARRTVAKYREAIGILPSRRRRDPYA